MTNLKKTPLAIIRGDTVHLDVHVSDANGEPWVLKDGEKLIFGVKVTPSCREYRLKKYIESGASPFRITLAPADTAGLSLGGYHYDIGLQSGRNYFRVVPTSPFKLCSDITKWEG